MPALFHELASGARMFLHAQSLRAHDYPRHGGDAAQICRAIVDACWNGEYFRTSAGHFDEFWTRDFSFCATSLARCGYRRQAEATLAWALDYFSKAGVITTHITRGEEPLDFPCLAADSLPLIVHALVELGARKLVREHRHFLETQAALHTRAVMDEKTSLVRRGLSLSSIKDHAVRESSAYDNAMMAMLKHDLAALKLSNPLQAVDIKGAMEDGLWNGSYFFEDMRRKALVTGDANTFPFWCGVFTEKKMIRKSIAQIRRERLDVPLPLRYTSVRGRIGRMRAYDLIAGGYERDTVWPHMGFCYMDVVRSADRKLFSDYVRRYREEVEQRGNLVELFFASGEPFRTLIYAADHDMLWAAKLLDFLR